MAGTHIPVRNTAAVWDITTSFILKHPFSRANCPTRKAQSLSQQKHLFNFPFPDNFSCHTRLWVEMANAGAWVFPSLNDKKFVTFCRVPNQTAWGRNTWNHCSKQRENPKQFHLFKYQRGCFSFACQACRLSMSFLMLSSPVGHFFRIRMT